MYEITLSEHSSIANYTISNPKVWGLKILLTHIIYKAQTQTQSQFKCENCAIRFV